MNFKKVLPFFSYAFHPIFISVFAVLFYFIVSTDYYNYETIYLFLLQTLIITVFLPLAIFYLLVHLKKIDSVMVTNIKQRKIPLFLQLILIAFIIVKTFRLDNFPELFYFFLGNAISSFIAFILVFWKQKISLHMLAMASLTIFCICCSIHFGAKAYYFITILLLCNGLVATSRLYMKAHTMKEIVLGYCIGLLPQLAVLGMWL